MQVLIVRQDMKMKSRKIASQCALQVAILHLALVIRPHEVTDCNYILVVNQCTHKVYYFKILEI